MSQTKSSIIYEKIKQDLTDGLYPAGEKLKISRLKENYNISLTPLREALSQLAAQGMIDQENNKGFSIPNLSYLDILDIKQTRILVETEALRLSIRNGDMDWEASLVATHHKLDRLSLSLKDLEAWSAAHEEFHSILLSGSGSKYLLDFSARLHLALDKYRRIAEPNQKIRKTLDAQHSELLQLALERNIEKAVEVLTSHITLSCQSAIDLLASKEAQP
ncbi:FCD domain-containing protein [Vibrio sp. ZF57]|uniref:GntR family transcriptional regulator n=1 Tax=Vibrio TaxID=662 RepID=UPI00080D93A2|nr:FCD domain-containing protein [Vibrio sp. ZF57]OCH54336.1 hypothetical protein A6D97_09885 [Vibrio sp. ZF57]